MRHRAITRQIDYIVYSVKTCLLRIGEARVCPVKCQTIALMVIHVEVLVEAVCSLVPYYSDRRVAIVGQS